MKDGFAVGLSRVTEHDAKHPASSSLVLARGGVSSRDPCSGAEVHLSFFAGSDFHASNKLWCLLLQLRDVTPNAVILCLEAILFKDVLPDALSRQTLLELAKDFIAIGSHSLREPADGSTPPLPEDEPTAMLATLVSESFSAT